MSPGRVPIFGFFVLDSGHSGLADIRTNQYEICYFRKFDWGGASRLVYIISKAVSILVGGATSLRQSSAQSIDTSRFIT